MTSETQTLTIGAVALQARVPLDTVRYYERRGLLPPPPRTPAGYRQYPIDTVRRVSFIKRAQALGFTLEEIADLLALRSTADGGCDAVEREAQAAIARIDGKLAELGRMRSALARLAATCRTAHLPAECPLLAALDASPPANDADPAIG
jgi:MerR family copper efflux transcriptional regulator